MPSTYRPIAGEYRRAIRAAAAESDVSTLQWLALRLVDYAESATAEPDGGEQVMHSQYRVGGRAAGERGRA